MNYQQWMNYSKLEMLVPSPAKRFQLPSLKRVGAYFSKFAFSNEPRVTEVADASGRTQWKIYDPDTDRTFQLGSAPEVTLWLEERYHNRQHNVW